MNRKWTHVLLAGMLLSGCQCSDHDSTQADSIASNNSEVAYNDSLTITDFELSTVPGGDKVLSPIMMKDLETHFSNHMMSQNEGDFETHIGYYYKPMLDIMGREELVKAVKYYSEEYGCKNYCNNFKITHVTPVVETDSLYYCIFEAKVDLDVIFTDKFQEDPKKWAEMIKSKFPSAIYDEAGRKYHCDEIIKFIGITPKDTLDFRFLYYNYFTDERLSRLIDQTTFLKLRNLESN